MAVVIFREMGRNNLSPLGHGALSQLPKITIAHHHKQQIRILLHFLGPGGENLSSLFQVLGVLAL